MHIDQYHFGHIDIEGHGYDTDVIIFPDRVQDRWWRQEGHRLAREDLDTVLADKPELRKRVRQLSARVAKFERKALRLTRKADRIRGSKQTAVRKVERIRGRIVNKIEKREAAEDALKARIKRMVELARDRAAARTRARPAVTGFRKPVRGRITQRYGCTRSRKTASFIAPPP